MENYKMINILLNKTLIPDLANITLSYIQDPLKRWSRNLYKSVLEDILVWGELVWEEGDIDKIKVYYHQHCTSYKYQHIEYFEDHILYEIKSRKNQLCTQCKNEQCLEEFGAYKTCKTCRFRTARNRKIKKYHKKFNKWINEIGDIPLSVIYFKHEPYIETVLFNFYKPLSYFMVSRIKMDFIYVNNELSVSLTYTR